MGSELFAVLIGRHNPGKLPEKDKQILQLIEKLNNDYEQYIIIIAKRISKFFEYDATFELQKRMEIKDGTHIYSI